MWSYINKISSLEKKASTQVAINLCQENDFKEVALCLEKPTYGEFIDFHKTSIFESDPEKLSVWAKVKEDDQLCSDFMRSCYLNDTEKVRRWETAVDKQCRRLTEGIPDLLRQKIHPWINRIALDYLSYSRRQEVLCGVSRYFLMSIFTRGDWKETARLDEKKLAQRLLEDERLTVLQRYRIACVYCLHVHIPPLWERLTQEEKRWDKYECPEAEVWFWSSYMEKKEAFPKLDLWYLISVSDDRIFYENSAVLMMCWNEVLETTQQMFVIRSALQSLQQYQSVEEFHVKGKLVSYQSPENQSKRNYDRMKHFNLPSYYSELIFFFLSQMDEEQQWIFFKESFKIQNCYQGKYFSKSILECFLEWPHQDGFLLTINQLWGIIPKDKYVQCLLALASKYSGDDTKANCDYDYRSLLRALWEETPEEYQQYVFQDKNPNNSVINEGVKLLSQLLERSPFQEKDEALFRRIFHNQPRKQKRAMMHSTEGEYMCMGLLQKEKSSFLNGLLVKCFSKEEIPDFKKRFILSTCGVKLTLDALKENREKVVEDLLDWSLEAEETPNAEKCKDELKYALLKGKACLDECEILLRKGKFAEVEHMINFCLSSDEKKEQFKKRFARRAYFVLLRDFLLDSCKENCVGEQMDTILAWSVGTEEKVRDFKKEICSRTKTNIL